MFNDNLNLVVQYLYESCERLIDKISNQFHKGYVNTDSPSYGWVNVTDESGNDIQVRFDIDPEYSHANIFVKFDNGMTENFLDYLHSLDLPYRQEFLIIVYEAILKNRTERVLSSSVEDQLN